MSGARVEVRLEDAAVQAAFRRLMALSTDQTPLMRRIGAQLRQHVDERFEEGKGPGRLPWQKSRGAEDEGGQTLIDTARLRQSITFRAGPSFAEIGTNVIYGPIHQFGGTIKAKTAKGLVFRVGGKRVGGRIGKGGFRVGSRIEGGSWRRVQQVTIPARPFLGIDDQDRAEISAIVAEQLARMTAGPTA